MQVKPTPPPVFQPSASVSPPTRAHRLRSAASHAAMQRSTDACTAQTAHDNHDRRSTARTVRRPSDAADGSHPAESHDQIIALPSDVSMAVGAASTEDVSAKSGSMSNVHHGNGHDVADNVDMPSLPEETSVHTFVQGSSVCCCVPDRLVAIHVRSELTESHFDM